MAETHDTLEAEIERLRAALTFIEDYASKQFNATSSADETAHPRDLYTIAQLCLEALDGKPLTAEMVSEDSAPKVWKPKEGDRVNSPYGTGVISRKYTQPTIHYSVVYDDETIKGRLGYHEQDELTLIASSDG